MRKSVQPRQVPRVTSPTASEATWEGPAIGLGPSRSRSTSHNPYSHRYVHHIKTKNGEIESEYTRRYDAPGISYSTSSAGRQSTGGGRNDDRNDDTFVDAESTLASEPGPFFHEVQSAEEESTLVTNEPEGHRYDHDNSRQPNRLRPESAKEKAEKLLEAFTDGAERVSATIKEQTEKTSQMIFSTVTDEARRASMSLAQAKQSSQDLDDQDASKQPNRRKTLGGPTTNIFHYLYKDCAQENGSMASQSQLMSYHEPDAGTKVPSLINTDGGETIRSDEGMTASHSMSTTSNTASLLTKSVITGPMYRGKVQVSASDGTQKALEELDEIVASQDSCSDMKPSPSKHRPSSSKGTDKPQKHELFKIAEEASEKTFVHSQDEDPCMAMKKTSYVHGSVALNQFCLTVTETNRVREAMHLVTTQTAAAMDESGRLALHCISENMGLAQAIAWPDEEHSLSTMLTRRLTATSPTSAGSRRLPLGNTPNSPSSQNHLSQAGEGPQDLEETVIDFVLNGLLEAYPAAMITPDAKGQIPFEAALSQWVDGELEIAKESPKGYPKQTRRTERSGSVAEILQRTMVRSTSWASNRHQTQDNPPSIEVIPQSMEEGGDIKLACSTESSRGKNEYYFPSNVKLSPGAYYCIRLLSAIVDKLEEGISSSRALPFMSPTRSLLQGSYNSQESSVQLLKDTTTLDIRSEIIYSIASIPGLLKVILLTEDEDQRDFLMSSTIVKSILAHEASIGSWLTSMLQSGERRLTDRCLEYIELVSSDKFWAETASRSVQEQTSRRSKKWGLLMDNMRVDLYDKVSHLPNFVPSLLSLRGKSIEEASTTNLVRRVMDRIIARPFCATLVFCDALFLAVMIAGFRMAVHRLIRNYSPASILSFVYISNMGIFYFVIREVGKAVSLSMINRQTGLYFLSFWNATDLFATFFALISTVAIRFHFSESSNDENTEGVPDSLRYLLTITTGLLWLKVLSFLKGINMQLATFVLAILQISRDVFWFCVILITLLISFAQMFFTLMAPDSCTAESGEATCSQSEYYLTMYSMLIFQEFDRESYDSVVSVILVVIYGFTVALVLLNVLIAVASDSYEKCLLRSQHLFGRARIMMISEMVSFQHLLRRNSGDTDALSIYRTWWSTDTAAGWSRASMVFFSISSVIVLLWVIAETGGYFSGPGHGNMIMSLTSVLATVFLFVAMMFFLANSAGNTESGMVDRNKNTKTSSLGKIGSRFESLVHRFVLRLLGTSMNEGRSGFSDQLESEWKGRIHYLEKTIEKMTEDQRIMTREHFEKVESSIRQEVASLELSFQTLKEQVTQPTNLNQEDVPVTLSEAIQALQKVLVTIR